MRTRRSWALVLRLVHVEEAREDKMWLLGFLTPSPVLFPLATLQLPGQSAATYWAGCLGSALSHPEAGSVTEDHEPRSLHEQGHMN